MDERRAQVRPEPTTEEREVVLAALGQEPQDERRAPPPWSAAGLREAVDKELGA